MSEAAAAMAAALPSMLARRGEMRAADGNTGLVCSPVDDKPQAFAVKACTVVLQYAGSPLPRACRVIDVGIRSHLHRQCVCRVQRRQPQ